MAEKEDYIVISKKDFDYEKGHYVTHLAKQVSRQEAIEKMAKKIDEAYIDENGCNKGLTMEELAEAALNALLEE